jgi:hypothetical protein
MLEDLKGAIVDPANTIVDKRADNIFRIVENQWESHQKGVNTIYMKLHGRAEVRRVN